MFVKDLCIAYLKWANYNDLKSEILYESEDSGKIVCKFSGKNVWKAFEHESGKHCVQRVPPTESKGRVHTSSISVAVLPLLGNLNTELNKNDVQITTQGGHGKGGQHQNTTDSAVRAVHKPTGLKVFINGRNQHVNRRTALEILTNRVNEHYKKEKVSAHNADRKGQMGGGGRSGKTRTYNFVDSRVVDHKLNKKTTKIKQIMRGKFDILFECN